MLKPKPVVQGNRMPVLAKPKSRVEFKFKGHMYRLVAWWSSGWVVTTYKDDRQIEKQRYEVETGPAALLTALKKYLDK